MSHAEARESTSHTKGGRLHGMHHMTPADNISWPRNVIMSHFLAKKCYQPVGSVITFLRREIVTPITDII